MINQTAVEFSCLINVSNYSLHESEWLTVQPGDGFNFTINGYIISAIMIIFLLLGLPWNCLVIGIILKQRLFTQPPFMLMLNLALTNSLFFLLVSPFNIVSGIAGEYIFGPSDRVRCRVCQTGIAVAILPVISTHTLSVMSVDRLIYLKRPMTYPKLVTPWRMLAAIACIWVLGVLLALPPVFGFGEVRFSHTVATCIVLVGGRTEVVPNYFYILLLLAEGAVPFLVLCVMYVWVMCIARRYLMKSLHRSLARLSRRRHTRVRSEVLKQHSKSQMVLVKVFSLVFTSSVITWLPVVPLVVCVAVLGEERVPAAYYTVVYLSYISGAVIHPVLQACMLMEIRDTLKGACCSPCKMKQPTAPAEFPPHADPPTSDSTPADSPASNSPTTNSPPADSLTANSPTANSPTANSPPANSLTTNSLTADSPITDSSTADSPTADYA